jgi:branched-chain amino acid transport system substrate-binding protein
MKKVAIVITCTLFLMTVMLGSASAADTIKVGVVLPLTGKLAKFGEIENKSFIMAAEEINAAGGINGKKIELIIEDTTGKPDVGRSAIEKLITQDKVPLIGGGYSSSVTWATIAVAQQNKVPFLVNTGSADKITEQGWDYIFRLNPPVSEYPEAFADFAKEIGKDIKSVAILHENSLFGQSGSKKFVKQAEALGMEVLIKEGYEAGAVDFKPLLVKAKSKKPDLVYMISYIMDASLLMRQSKELNLNPKLFVGGAAGFTLPEFQKNAGKASAFVYSATLWTPSVPYPGAKEYYDKFVAKYNSPTEYHGAEAYAGMYVIADALKRAKSLSRKDVRDALAATDMMTVFGPVKFVSYGKKTQQNKLPTFLVQWIDGKLETVWPQKVATKGYIYPTPKWNKR